MKQSLIVESTDCNNDDDDDDDIATYYRLPVVYLPHKPTGHPPLFILSQVREVTYYRY